MAFTAEFAGSGVTDPYLTLSVSGKHGLYSVDWGDGTVDSREQTSGEEGFFSHEFADGVFEIAVTRGDNPVAISFHAEVHASARDDVVIVGTDLSDFLFAGAGDDQVGGGVGDDLLNGARGADLLDGGGGDDQLLGGTGSDTLTGGKGDDLLSGGNGRDALSGGDGDDVLIGESGSDVMTGGAGHDRFVITPQFGPVYSLNPGHDVITDFESGSDKLAVIDWPNFGSHLTFIGGEHFDGLAAELRVVDRGGFAIVSADYDGDGKGDFSFRVEGDVPVQSDFIL